MAHRRVLGEESAFVSGERVFTVEALPELAEFRLNLLPGCALVTATGEVDIATTPALREAIGEGLAQSPRLVVDLKDVRFFDSTGLHVLVGALKHAEEKGGRLILVEPGGMVRRVLQGTRLDHVFTIRWDLPGAVADAAL